MKKFKKFLAVLLAAVMVMAMTTSVFAVTTGTDSDGNTIYYEETTDTDGNTVVTYYDDDIKTTKLKTVTTSYDSTTETTVVYDSNGEVETTTVVVTDTSAGTVTTTVTDASGNVTTTVTDSTLGTSTTTYTIKIDNSTSGYTYQAYQIFTGDLSDDGTTLSNITFGSALSADQQTAILTKYNVSDAAALAAALTDNTIKASDFAAYLATLSLTQFGSDITYSNGYSFTTTAAGYYLIVNSVVPSTAGAEAYSSYILEVVKSVTVEPKNTTVPTTDKTVGDINDSTETTATTSTTDTADYDIGDDVPFTLSATMSSDYGDYTVYKLTFHDTLSSGFSFNNNVVVTVTTNGTATTIPATGQDSTGNEVTNYTVNYTSDTTQSDGCTFEVVFTDTNTLYDANGNKITVSAGSVITASYSAKLTSSAAFTNTNSVYITYSNNPNETDGSSTGTSTTDVVTVFTYTLTVNKTDGTNALAGAGFTLYKYVGTSVSGADSEGFIVVSAISAGTTTEFTFNGLDDGYYKLVETKTPSGYNTISDIYFTITAEHTEDSDGNASVKSLTVTQTDSSWNALTSGTQTFSATESTGSITTNVINNKGTSIPTTGGIGTTMFYVIGTILVLGAAVMLVTRRRVGR